MNEIAATKDKEQSLLSVSNFEHAMKVSEFISKSELVPKDMRGKPADILLAMEFGRRLGLGELQAIQNIAVINGRPSMWGDSVLAVCQGHPECESIKEEDNGKKGDEFGYTCTVLRRGYDPIVRKFTVEDAKKAGLWGRTGPWSQYPKRMVQMRSRSWALRDAFADALSGVQVREEVNDYEIKDVTPKQKNKAQNIIADLTAKHIPAPKKMVSSAQVEIIEQLFVDRDINAERKSKALAMYKCKSIIELSESQADELIVILEKGVNAK